MIGLLLIAAGMGLIIIGFLLVTMGSNNDTGFREFVHADRDRTYTPYHEENYVKNTTDHQKYDSRDAAVKGGRVRGGGVIMLGPIPILIGTDTKSLKTVMILAILLMILSLLFFR
ncbi:MAG: DUF131 domain-containing protein [Methanosarcinaceae archaeon]|nr:DUF131 domain-containing protein [Methanosarcinaceae archaeon]